MSRCKRGACILWCVCAVWCAPGLRTASAWQSSIDAIKQKSTLAADDLVVLQAEIQDVVSRLQSDLEDPRAAELAATRFIQRVRELYEGGARGYQQALAEQCSTVFAQQAQSSGDLGWILVNGLAQFGDPATLAGLRTAGASNDPMVRALVVEAIRGYPANLAADQVTACATLLAESGRRERNAVVLRRIYEVLKFDQQRTEQGRTILDILEHRLPLIDQVGNLPGEAAEVAALVRLSALATNLSSEADSVRLVQAVARLMAYTTHRYLYDDVSSDHRLELQKMMVLAERLLEQVTGQRGELEQAVVGGAETRPEDIRVAVLGWVGDGDTTGRLSDGRWQVPVGGGLKARPFAALTHP